MNLHLIKICLSFLCSLQSILSGAQVKKQHCGSIACDSFRVFDENRKLKLPSLQTSGDSLYFRYYTNCNVVDVWSEDGVLFNGAVTTYTYESYNKAGQIRKSKKYFFTKAPLNSETAEKIYDLSRNIASIPTGDSIKKQKVGSADGSSRVFVTATPSCICQKSYWNALGREEPEFTQKLNPVIKAIDSILDLKSRRDKFIFGLKPGHGYYLDEQTILVVNRLNGKKTEEINRKYHNDDYLGSISDSLNKYLSDTLTNIFAKQQPIKCFIDFRLHFSSENRLSKVTAKDKFDSRTERREFRKYCHLIREAFKTVDLSFVHSELDYCKKLEFEDGKAIVSDL